MNHLAHFLLSCGSEDMMIGNFVADYIRNKEVVTYSQAIQDGIILHRKIDSFTDSHPIVKQGTKRLHNYHGKYAPVVLDVLYDNLLHKNWKRYSGQPLGAFTQGIYRSLESRFDDLPQKLQTRLPDMIAADWLQQYGKDEGLRFVFGKMDKRTSFPSNFVAAVEHLKEAYAAYETEFNVFFPELTAYVEQECLC